MTKLKNLKKTTSSLYASHSPVLSHELYELRLQKKQGPKHKRFTSAALPTVLTSLAPDVIIQFFKLSIYVKRQLQYILTNKDLFPHVPPGLITY